VTEGPVVNLRLVMTTVPAHGHGWSTRRPSLYRGPADHDNQIQPSSAWALFQSSPSDACKPIMIPTGGTCALFEFS